jgi:hypothetical protein
MAVRKPVKIDGSNNIIAMNASDITAMQNEAIRQYALRPAIELSHLPGGTPANTIGTLTDTRLQAGATATNASSFPSAAATPDVTEVTVTWNKIAQAIAVDQPIPVDSDDRGYPLYIDGSNNLRAMTDSDYLDTFIIPAIDRLSTGTTTPAENGGTYFISTITTDPNGTLISALPVFTDTRANTAVYTSGGIPEALDQPIDITSYYLFRVNAPSEGSFPRTLRLRADGQIDLQSKANVQKKLAGGILWATNKLVGKRIRYELNTSGGAGNNRGSGMVNTRLNSSLYQQRLINSNDYRTQEFPAGTPTTISTTFLKIRQT